MGIFQGVRISILGRFDGDLRWFELKFEPNMKQKLHMKKDKMCIPRVSFMFPHVPNMYPLYIYVYICMRYILDTCALEKFLNLISTMILTLNHSKSLPIILNFYILTHLYVSPNSKHTDKENSFLPIFFLMLYIIGNFF